MWSFIVDGMILDGTIHEIRVSQNLVGFQEKFYQTKLKKTYQWENKLISPNKEQRVVNNNTGLAWQTKTMRKQDDALHRRSSCQTFRRRRSPACPPPDGIWRSMGPYDSWIVIYTGLKIMILNKSNDPRLHSYNGRTEFVENLTQLRQGSYRFSVTLPVSVSQSLQYRS